MASYSSILNKIDKAAQGTSSGYKKIKTLFSSNDNNRVSYIRDITTNGYLAQDSVFIPQFFARAFDEPTYLSFRIEFINNPAELAFRNAAYTNIGVTNNAFETLAYDTMYDYMPEPLLGGGNFSQAHYEDNNEKWGKEYSSEIYLDECVGDHGRACMLSNFKLALEDLQTVFPYYITKIAGLETLSKVDPKRGSRLKDAKITLTCDEGLDMKITQLLTLYKKIVWDDVYQRWVLPDMMRYFGMRIYVSEIRLFHDVIDSNLKSTDRVHDFSNENIRNSTNFNKKSKESIGLDNLTALSRNFLGTKSAITKALDWTSETLNTTNNVLSTLSGFFSDGRTLCNNAINQVMPTLCFECHMCEFDIDSIYGHISNLESSNKSKSSVSPNIVIKVGQVSEVHSFPLNATLVPDPNNNERYADTVRNPVNVNKITDRSSSKNSMYLGNFVSDQLLNEKYNAYVNNSTDDYMTTKANRMSYYASKAYAHVGNGYDQINERRFNTVTRNLLGKSTTGIGLSYEENALLAETALTSTVIGGANLIQDIKSLRPKSTAISGGLDGENSAKVTASKLRNNNDNAEISKNAIIESTKSSLSDFSKNGQYDYDETKNSIIKSMKDMSAYLNSAIDRIYNSDEVKSMAISDEAKAKIANNMFDEFIKNLDESTATENSILRNFIDNYKVLKNEEDSKYKSTATSQSFNELN